MPELDRNRPFERQGRRECRALAATHGPPATKNAGGSHHRSSRTSGIPCAMGLRIIRALPGDRLDCPRFAPTRFRALRRTPAPGRQDHATSPSAPISRRATAPDEPRPPHPTSRIVTIARTPLARGGMARMKTLIWVCCQELFRKSESSRALHLSCRSKVAGSEGFGKIFGSPALRHGCNFLRRS